MCTYVLHCFANVRRIFEPFFVGGNKRRDFNRLLYEILQYIGGVGHIVNRLNIRVGKIVGFPFHKPAFHGVSCGKSYATYGKILSLTKCVVAHSSDNQRVFHKTTYRSVNAFNVTAFYEIVKRNFETVRCVYESAFTLLKTWIFHILRQNLDIKFFVSCTTHTTIISHFLYFTTEN